MKAPLLTLAALLASLAEADTLTFTGTARDPDSGEPLYEEEHRLVTENGQPRSQRVHYRAPDGTTLAFKEMDYSEAARPAYRMELPEQNRVEEVVPDEAGVTVSGRESGRVDWPDGPAVIDAGFHYFILAHFDRLVAGEAVRFEFLAPSRLSWTALVIEPRQADDDRLELELRLQNPLLGWLVDPIGLTYDREEQRLLEYRGLTNLPSEDGGHYRAHIDYRYPEDPS